MKILLLTSPEYDEFVYNIVGKFHDVLVWDYGRYDFVSDFDYDVGISFLHQYKVPRYEFELEKTWFNFHPGPLPEYKGRNLCYHAIMNGEKEFGATVHYMDENFDTGDIIEVTKFEIAPWWTAEDLSEFTLIASKNLFEEYFPRILAGEEFPRIKNEGGTYYKKEIIADTFELDKANLVPAFWLNRFIRAVTYKDFYPKIRIHGVTYKVVRE